MKRFMATVLLLVGCGEVTPIAQMVEVRQDSKRDRRDKIATAVFVQILIRPEGNHDASVYGGSYSQRAQMAVKHADILIEELDR